MIEIHRYEDKVNDQTVFKMMICNGKVDKLPITKSQKALYNLLKKRYLNNEQFTKKDLMQVHSEYVKPVANNHYASTYGKEKTEVEKYETAREWLSKTLGILAIKDCFGLTFRR